jgi:DNA-binding beta-propeller fold protein YncE
MKSRLSSPREPFLRQGAAEGVDCSEDRGGIDARIRRAHRLLLAFGLFLIAGISIVGTAHAAPYRYEATASEELSNTVPGGAFTQPFALTFDSTGNLYVVDARGNAGHAIVDKFNSGNVFQAQLGSAALSTEFVRSVAVSDATGHLFVGEVEEPSFIGKVLALDAPGSELSHWSGAATPAATFGVSLLHVAVDNSPSVSSGDIYVQTKNEGGEVDVFESKENLSGELDTEEGEFVRKLEAPEGFQFEGAEGGIAVDGTTGEVYVVDSGHKVIDRFDAEGTFEGQIAGPSPSEPFGAPVAVAVDGASGDIFVIDGGANLVDKFSPTGQLLNQITGTGINNEPFEIPVGLAVAPSGPNAGEVFVADRGKRTVDVFAEEAPAAPSFEGVGVQEVTGESAAFRAEINPHGAATNYRFEYGRCSSPSSCALSAYGETVPVPDASLGSEDFTSHPTSLFSVHGLLPGTTYHLRALAHNVHGQVTSEERIFTTQGSASSLLPDGREWELVSPPDKHGGLVTGGGETAIAQVAADGSAISYLANAPTEAAPQGSAQGVQVLSARGPSGWASRDIATPNQAAPGASPGTSPEYHFFTEDLTSAVIQPFGLFNPTLSPEGSEQTPYLRSLGSCTTTCFRPLVTAANVSPPGTPFGEERLCEQNREENGEFQRVESVCGPRFEGASGDASHIVIRSAAPLASGAPRGGVEGGDTFGSLYEWSSGRLKLISVLPDGSAAPVDVGVDQPFLGSGFGQTRGTARHAISADGSRIFFESDGALYLRDTEAGHEQSIQIDDTEAGCPQCEGEAGGGRFQVASVDGSRVFFIDTHHLTADSGARSREPDLYECAVANSPSGELSCSLTDLTPSEGSNSANVQGDALGASEDGSALYFVADGTLGGVGGERGTCTNPEATQAPGTRCNLYLLRDGHSPRLVASLSGADAKDWTQFQQEQPTRVSPDGHWLTFMSQRSLTGYDNTDAVSERQDAEVFLYDSTGAGRLSCASCNPTGARPIGVEYESLTASGGSDVLPTTRGQWEGEEWVAALPPETKAFASRKPSYQPRYLNDSGRLYFNGLDALVPQDTNATGDVYQFEPAGVGSCSISVPTYSPVSGGCDDLISSGTSPENSAFIDASKSGNDVFFFTGSRLRPEDVDSRRDVYDAHVCSAEVPCLPEPPPAPPACEGDACQLPATPPVDATPGSLTFSGAGNVLECPKGKVKKGGKCVKKKQAKKHKKKQHKKTNKKKGGKAKKPAASKGGGKK